MKAIKFTVKGNKNGRALLITPKPELPSIRPARSGETIYNGAGMLAIKTPTTNILRRLT